MTKWLLKRKDKEEEEIEMLKIKITDRGDLLLYEFCEYNDGLGMINGSRLYEGIAAGEWSYCKRVEKYGPPRHATR